MNKDALRATNIFLIFLVWALAEYLKLSIKKRKKGMITEPEIKYDDPVDEAGKKIVEALKALLPKA